VPKTAALLTEQGFSADAVRRVTYANALAAYGQSGQMSEGDWERPAQVDQRDLYVGNTVLRGGQNPRVDAARS
jgi:hypothetical protein